MARNKLIEKSEQVVDVLKDLVSRFLEKKPQYDELKKEVDSINKDIKNQMSEQGLKEYSIGDNKVSLSISERVSYDEDKLLEVLKPLKIKGLVVKKEVVAQDILEKILYAESIQDEKPVTELLEKIAEKKETTTLRTGKVN